MELTLLRHAIAVERGDPAFPNDAERPLTEEGRTKLKGVCRGLESLKPHWDLILSSPYLRTLQTASMVAEHFGMTHRLKEGLSLTPGNQPKHVIQEISTLKDVKSVLIVGHEPLLSQCLSSFIFGMIKGDIQLKKAGAALVDFDGIPKEGEGKLKWLMTPSQLRRLGKK